MSAGATLRNPVFLVHGIDDTIDQVGHLGRFLQSRHDGLQVYSLNLVPNNGDAGLDQLGRQLAVYIEANVPAGRPVDLVGFSMGGLVSRYYLQRLGGLERVRRFIAIASPHHGTWTAYLRANEGARQMRPGSQFLKDLNRDAASLERVRFASIWTPFDLMIVPAKSSVLGVGRSIRVSVAAHPLMVRDRRVLALVHQLLAE